MDSKALANCGPDPRSFGRAVFIGCGCEKIIRVLVQAKGLASGVMRSAIHNDTYLAADEFSPIPPSAQAAVRGRWSPAGRSGSVVLLVDSGGEQFRGNLRTLGFGEYRYLCHSFRFVTGEGVNLSTLAIFTQFGRVFPLRPGTKLPLVKWTELATESLEDIDRWLARYPDAGWALVPDRAFIVDVDVKNGAAGPASIEAAGGLDPTFSIKTPSGGTHHYYAPDPDLPFQTRNGWIPGVDIRYGGDGYIVLPYTKTTDGDYAVETDLDDVETSVSKGRTRLTDSILPAIPSWMKERLLLEPVQETTQRTPLCDVQKCDTEWKQVRDEVRYLFFRRQKNKRIWNHKPVDTMTDHSQSGYEWQLAKRLMYVGATDEEVITVYRIWCRRHLLRIKQDRFLKHTIPAARLATAAYVEKWNASQPKRRKHGTTTKQITDAIVAGNKRASEIEKYTGLKGSTVRMQVKRMLAAGKLVKDSLGYDVPGVCGPLVESMAA